MIKYARRVSVLLTLLFIATMGLMGGTAQAACDPQDQACGEYVLNLSSNAIGVVRDVDGVYTLGNYDRRLLAGHNTLDDYGWRDGAGGVYHAYGWCVRLEQWTGQWSYVGDSTKQAGIIRLVKPNTWRVTQYSCI
jgi:hypothetical protein